MKPSQKVAITAELLNLEREVEELIKDVSLHGGRKLFHTKITWPQINRLRQLNVGVEFGDNGVVILSTSQLDCLSSEPVTQDPEGL